jgi:hypothetical protein
MENRSIPLLAAFGILAAAAYAQGDSSSPLSFIGWRLEDAVRLVLCALWSIIAIILATLVIISGLKYITSEDSGQKDKARKMVVQGFIAFIIVVIACPTVNYIVHGSDVKEFKCDCIRVVPPTTTTVTTTTTWTFATVTTVTSTTSTTFTTTTTMYPKSGGGRFLLVGIDIFDWGSYKEGDMYGVIFNMDGTIHKNAFFIDSGVVDPVSLAVGPNRFFVGYSSNAVILDWEGNTVKAKFTTKTGYFPVKAIQTNNKYYVLLSPKGGGGCVIQVYGLDGDLQNSYSVAVDKVGTSALGFGGSYFAEGDMALGNGKLFITWTDHTNNVIYGIIYDMTGNQVKSKFEITTISSSSTCGFDNAEVEAGQKYFIVAYLDKVYLYDLNGVYQTSKTTSADIVCVHDFVYGDGKFMEAYNNAAEYLDEDGNVVGPGTFGGHGDVPTSLAYGNKMFVGIVAIHTTDDGIGASFLDFNGNHIVDALPLVMAESPGWAAYDW